jgi:hypothetical protein
MPCRPHRQGRRQNQVRCLLHWRRAWAGVGQPRHPCLFRDARTSGLSRPQGCSSWWEEFHCGADSGNRRGDGHSSLPPGKSRRPTFQHGYVIRCGGRTAGPRRGAAATSPSASTSTGIFRSSGVSIVTSLPTPWGAPSTPGTTKPTLGTRAGSEPETRNVIWLLDRFPNIRYFVDLHSYGETILHSWGSDQNQSDDPRMSFRNPAYDGKRGLIHDDVYANTLRRRTRERRYEWAGTWPRRSNACADANTESSSSVGLTRPPPLRTTTRIAATSSTRVRARSLPSRWSGVAAGH